MTDERLGDGLFAAIAALPRRSGIVFRHYSLAPPARRALLHRVTQAARRRSHCLVVADPPAGVRASGIHLPGHARRLPLPRPPILTAAVHAMPERARAAARRADLIFISPVFATLSHPGGRVLGAHGLARLTARAPAPVIALGGMTGPRFRRLAAGLPIHGYAAITSLAARPGARPTGQKASAPPT